MTTHRRERVESLIHREISTILARKVSDPRVQGVHVVSVQVSPDFHLARVNYSSMYDNLDMDSVQEGLDHAKPFIRNGLKKNLKLRVLPELAFFYEPSIKHGDHILELLRTLAPKDEK